MNSPYQPPSGVDREPTCDSNLSATLQNFRLWFLVFLLLIPAVAIQCLMLNCKCQNGSVKVGVAMLGSILIATRGVVGYVRRQDGRPAFLYSALYFLLIPLLQLLTFVKTGSFH